MNFFAVKAFSVGFCSIYLESPHELQVSPIRVNCNAKRLFRFLALGENSKRLIA